MPAQKARKLPRLIINIHKCMGYEINLEKEAQRRSIRQWLSEKVAPRRKLTEWSSPEYKEQMEMLRALDTEIREDAKSLSDNISYARKSLNKRHYLDVAHFINNINTTVKDIYMKSRPLAAKRSEHEEKILTHRDFADPHANYFRTEAGIKDFFKRRYEERAKHMLLGQQKRALTELYNQARTLITQVKDAFVALGTLRANGDVEAYLKILDELEEYRKNFEKEFKTIYDQHVEPLAAKVRERAKEDAAEGLQKGVWPDPERNLEVTYPKPGDAELVVEMPADSVAPTPAAPRKFPEAPSMPRFPNVERPSWMPEQEQPPAPTPDIPPQVVTITTPEATPPAEEVVPTPAIPETPAAKSRKKKQAISMVGLKDPNLAEKIYKAAEGLALTDKRAMLIEYSELFDEAGDIETSMKLLALAEGI